MSEKDGVGAEGVDVVEAMNDAVKRTVSGRTEVDRVDLVDDGALPPEVGGDAGADPARAGKRLRCGEGHGRDESVSEAEGEKSAGSSVEVDHALVIEMLRETAGEWDDGVWTGSGSLR